MDIAGQVCDFIKTFPQKNHDYRRAHNRAKSWSIKHPDLSKRKYIFLIHISNDITVLHTKNAGESFY